MSPLSATFYLKRIVRFGKFADVFGQNIGGFCSFYLFIYLFLVLHRLLAMNSLTFFYLCSTPVISKTAISMHPLISKNKPDKCLFYI